MANKTILQLDPLTTADASDLLAIYDVSENGTDRITAANLLNTTTISGLETTAKTIPAAINELNTNLFYKNYTGTTGTEQYTNFYYVDIDISDYIQSCFPVSFYVLSATSYRPVFLTRHSNSIRAYSNVASTTINIRVIWSKQELFLE